MSLLILMRGWLMRKQRLARTLSQEKLRGIARLMTPPLHCLITRIVLSVTRLRQRKRQHGQQRVVRHRMR